MSKISLPSTDSCLNLLTTCFLLKLYNTNGTQASFMVELILLVCKWSWAMVLCHNSFFVCIQQFVPTCFVAFTATIAFAVGVVDQEIQEWSFLISSTACSAAFLSSFYLHAATYFAKFEAWPHLSRSCIRLQRFAIFTLSFGASQICSKWARLTIVASAKRHGASEQAIGDASSSRLHM